ncbi:hypothetical protein TRVL_07185 [Trypanosoma vivax]|nr:hypothetical protein TRVL_07185 [Trypanosoma vivax]
MFEKATGTLRPTFRRTPRTPALLSQHPLASFNVTEGASRSRGEAALGDWDHARGGVDVPQPREAGGIEPSSRALGARAGTRRYTIISCTNRERGRRAARKETGAQRPSSRRRRRRRTGAARRGLLAPLCASLAAGV